MFTLKQMGYFEVLARERHFGRAAASAHVTQPALSAQIAEMERLAGCALFERQRSGVLLTPAGARLLPAIRAILAQVDGLADLAGSTGSLLEGTLRLGMIPTIAPYLLPVLLPVLQANHPQLDLKVRETVTDTLVQELRDGALDAIIAAAPIKATGIQTIPLFSDRFYIASSANTTDVMASPMTPDAVVMERLLLLDEGHCLRDQALDVCAVAGERRLVNFGATSLNTLLQMVGNGMGLTLLPEIALPAESASLRSLTITPFAPPEPSRQLALFHRTSSPRSQDFEALADAARQAGSQLLDRAA